MEELNIEILTQCVRKQFAISKKGPGLLPCDTEWEDSVHSANAVMTFLLTIAQFDESQIMSELGMTPAEFMPVRKLSKKIWEDDRHSKKVMLCINRYFNFTGDLYFRNEISKLPTH